MGVLASTRLDSEAREITTLEARRHRHCFWGAPGGDAQYQAELEGCNDARTGMPPGIPEGAMCVQRFDDSLNSAIHITYRISLRSSSMPEPRDPLLKVLTYYIYYSDDNIQSLGVSGGREPAYAGSREAGPPKQQSIINKGWEIYPEGQVLFSDPSAGSPTETLLRLLLPLNDQV